jgi:hypothetical protein
MMRLEKCELLKSKGYTYDPETGNIYGIRGKVLTTKTKGYRYIHLGKGIRLAQHHFAWYMIYGNVDFIELDHINRIKTDNRICNLRISNRTLQQYNRDAKGYYQYGRTKKWISRIQVDKKNICLGTFDTEEEARQAYLQAKKKYHIID